jgi:hypothetical protein
MTEQHLISRLWEDYAAIPTVQGVYLILKPSEDYPTFLEKGAGGFFKQRDPNLPVAQLAARWIPSCKVLYVGKAGGASSGATLRSRLRQYLDFGQGKPVGDYGGRLIWQLKHHPELMVAWKVLAAGDPRAEERQINEAIVGYYSRLPFANLRP